MDILTEKIDIDWKKKRIFIEHDSVIFWILIYLIRHKEWYTKNGYHIMPSFDEKEEVDNSPEGASISMKMKFYSDLEFDALFENLAILIYLDIVEFVMITYKKRGEGGYKGYDMVCLMKERLEKLDFTDDEKKVFKERAQGEYEIDEVIYYLNDKNANIAIQDYINNCLKDEIRGYRDLYSFNKQLEIVTKALAIKAEEYGKRLFRVGYEDLHKKKGDWRSNIDLFSILLYLDYTGEIYLDARDTKFDSFEEGFNLPEIFKISFTEVGLEKYINQSNKPIEIKRLKASSTPVKIKLENDKLIINGIIIGLSKKQIELFNILELEELLEDDISLKGLSIRYDRNFEDFDKETQGKLVKRYYNALYELNKKVLLATKDINLLTLTLEYVSLNQNYTFEIQS